MVTLTERKFIRPLYNYLVCKPIVEKETAGGLALPDHVAKAGLGNLKRARVVRAGPGKRHEHTGEFVKCAIEPGQVIYPMGNVLAFEENGEELIVVPEEMVFGVEEFDPHLEN